MKDLDKIREEGRRKVSLEQRKLMMRMRAKTSLSDEEIRGMSGAYGKTSYDAGYRIGHAEGVQEHLANYHLLRWTTILLSTAFFVAILSYVAC